MTELLGSIPRLLVESLVETSKEFLQLDENELFDNKSDIIQRLLLIGSNKVLGTLIGITFDGLFEKKDSELKKLSKDLTKLIRQPILTGIEQLKVANLITPTNEMEESFQQQRYKAALENFDSAASLADYTEKPYLDLLRAITLLRINGGRQEAKMRFASFAEFSDTRLIFLSEQKAEIKAKVDQKLAEAEALKIEKLNIGGGLIGFTGSENHLKKQSLLTEVRQLEKKIHANEMECIFLTKTNSTVIITDALID